jgi:hypothetical protein
MVGPLVLQAAAGQIPSEPRHFAVDPLDELAELAFWTDRVTGEPA